VAWFTLWQAVVSTALTLLVAARRLRPVALEFRGRRALQAAVTVPFVLPTVVVGSAFLALLGPRSPVNAALVAVLGDAAPTLDLRRTVTAILLAHVFFNYAVVVRTVGGLWAMLDPRLEDAARVLGASRWRAFREVSLPLLRPRDRRLGRDRVPVHLHLLRGRADPRWTGPRHHRGGDPPGHHPAARPAARLGPGAAAAGRGAGGARRLRPADPPGQQRSGRRRLRTRRPPRTRGERWFLGANLAVIVGPRAQPAGRARRTLLVTADGYGLDNWRRLLTATELGAGGAGG
jgi:thiamine transport system permease protein